MRWFWFQKQTFMIATREKQTKIYTKISSFFLTIFLHTYNINFTLIIIHYYALRLYIV